MLYLDKMLKHQNNKIKTKKQFSEEPVSFYSAKTIDTKNSNYGS